MTCVSRISHREEVGTQHISGSVVALAVLSAWNGTFSEHKTRGSFCRCLCHPCIEQVLFAVVQYATTSSKLSLTGLSNFLFSTCFISLSKSEL